jgi:hypothetical protein
VSENPWRRLPDQPPFVLPEDWEKVKTFNDREERKAGQNHRLELRLIPQAFLGRPDAPLVLLGNVSGVSETGDQPPAAYKLKPEYADRMRRNLLHDLPEDFPFAGLDPHIAPLDEGWWARKLRYILGEFRNADAARPLLARKLFAVEFFPYVAYPNRYAHDGLALPSQAYSRSLVRNAVEQEAVIAFRHGERRWLKAVPKLEGHQRLVRLKDYHQGLISPNNCRDNGWSHIQAVIRRIEEAAGRVRNQ